ncbi:hypothetical protein [Klebsiella aerogenes]|uniref:hypothetical protein n=1 Tax=Klebsiella aerogenes TaxID=548 RepID=UPI001616D069|nr:hypothetical protein [Klebsiella aerogenes]MEB7639001.1 hypothetical protein [Klebsiella aerogenes]HDS4948810.1 hypothetical protein [Klebsiella aerogenes]
MAATPYPAYGTDAICRPGKRSAAGQGVVDAVVGPVSVAPPDRGRVDAVVGPVSVAPPGRVWLMPL